MTNRDTFSKLESWLPVFFDKYQTARSFQAVGVPKSRPPQINLEELAIWFDHMTQPLIDARQGAFQCNPWEIAGLGRDEVRNSAVLGWLLNPKGSHGLGDRALRGLLKELNYFDGKFPTTVGRYCNVRVESNPDGDIGNRVDIEIDGDIFYVLIEVKIDAPESQKQLERYGDIAAQQAGYRPWAMVFLTPDGHKPESAGKHADTVLPMSWHEMSCKLEQFIKPAFKSLQYSKSSSRHMAEQVAQCFLKRIRNF